MAVSKVCSSSKLVIRIQTGEMNGNNPVIKELSFSRIKSDAKDEELYAAGDALAGLQSHPVDGVRRVDTYSMTSEE
ncbi:MAG TPA: hypothetical protein DCS74_05860 [Veillonellaceae bacterium]|nr:hypothetical protein [Veillonellaceae bacterium]